MALILFYGSAAPFVKFYTARVGLLLLSSADAGRKGCVRRRMAS